MESYKVRIPSEDIAMVALLKNNDEPGWASIGRSAIHELVQNKAFRLGYAWGNLKEVKMDYIEFIFFGNDGLIYHTFDLSTNSEDINWYKKQPNKEISWKDFLILEEE